MNEIIINTIVIVDVCGGGSMTGGIDYRGKITV